jgi:hypothetical protein
MHKSFWQHSAPSQHVSTPSIMMIITLLTLLVALQGKGPAAGAVRDMVLRMRRENPGLLAASAGGWVSPVSQVTFEGSRSEPRHFCLSFFAHQSAMQPVSLAGYMKLVCRPCTAAGHVPS